MREFKSKTNPLNTFFQNYVALHFEAYRKQENVTDINFLVLY